MVLSLDSEELLRVLHGFNPWWENRTFQVPGMRRLAFSACRQLLDRKDLRRAILLSGPRRVGKTTILQQLTRAELDQGRDPRSILFLSLDHPLLRLAGLPRILETYHSQVHPEGFPALLLLDEIQYSTDWATELKLLVDHQPHYKLVATGSASVVQQQGISESGTGRWVTVQVSTLSFFEFTQLCGEGVPDLPRDLKPSTLFRSDGQDLRRIAAQLRPLKPGFARYLLVGGFPETARMEDLAFSQRLLREDIVDRVLKRDMVDLFGVRNVADLERIFLYLCLHTGGVLAHNALARELQIGTRTVANYLGLLEQANLVFRLAPARLQGKKVLKAQYKYYLVDAALRNAVLLRGEEVLRNPDELGIVVETAVLRHLHAYHYPERPELLYWREPGTGKEVDLIVRLPRFQMPFEVKYRETAKLLPKDGLVRYAGSEGLERAILVTKREADFGVGPLPGLDTACLRIPAHILCYLLGHAERQLWETPA